MAEGERERSGGFVAGLLLGTLSGIVLAIVAAPQSGEEARDAMLAQAGNKAARVREQADRLGDAVSQEAASLVERGRTILEAAHTRFEAAVAEGKEAAEQHRSELESRT